MHELLVEPLGFKLSRRQIAEGRVNPLVHVDLVQETTELAERIMVIDILAEVDLLFL